MAETRKRMSKKELQAPDQIQVTLEKTWDKVARYRKPLIGLAAALLVGAIVVGITTKMKRDAQEQAAEELFLAMSPLTAPLEDDPSFELRKLPEGIERFPDRAAAQKEAGKRLAEFVTKHPGSTAQSAADLALATTRLNAAEAPAAAGALEKWIATNPSSPLLVAAYARLGEAWLLAGDRAKAKDAFSKQAEIGEGGVKAMAHAALGDLQHPLIVPGGDAAAAKVQYQAALSALGPKPAEEAGGLFGGRNVPYLYEQIEMRLATLN